MSSRNDRCPINRRRSLSAVTSSRKTQSSREGKNRAAKSQCGRERRKENAGTTRDDDDPICVLRKEIHDWRTSGRVISDFERPGHLGEDETEERPLPQENHNESIERNLPEPNTFHGLPSSIAIDRSTRCT